MTDTAKADGNVARVCVREVAPSDFPAMVRLELRELGEMLIAKNRAYGNSALDPVRVFSRADPVEQLKVRIDDKLSRLMRGNEFGEDTVRDLIGYLVLLLIAQRKVPARDKFTRADMERMARDMLTAAVL